MNRRVVVAITLIIAITLIVGSIACASKRDSLSGNAELKPRSSPVAVGEMAPDFTLEDQNNRKVTLSAARGSRPTVLVFYRGNW
jgi:cytochrome oxidase Cu insertion factor (SCO1/SenC/PrrC family)